MEVLTETRGMASSTAEPAQRTVVASAAETASSHFASSRLSHPGASGVDAPPTGACFLDTSRVTLHLNR